MRGRFLGFTNNGEEGNVSTDNGSRFTFKSSDFNGDISRLAPGTELDFVGQDGVAKDVFRLTSSSSEKSKIAAGALAICLGGFGVHNFYLGYTKEGVIMLLLSILGFILFGLPTLIICIISIIEGVKYLTKTDDDFYYTYV